MYKHNIYTRPGLVGFGNYQGLGITPMTYRAVMSQKVGGAAAQPLVTTDEGLPVWAYIAIPVGVVAVAAIVYYKFF